MKDDEKLEGVALVRAILKNLHESLKWLWLIVMGLAIVNAIEVYSKFLDTDDIKKSVEIFTIFFNIESLVFISFLFVFIRFYFGDNRFLDLSYQETQFERGLKSEINKYSGIKRLMDILLLISHGVFFYLMSSQIGDIQKFLYFFVILLISNVFWLLIQLLGGINAQHPDIDPLIGNAKGSKPMIIWIINNLFFAILILQFIFSNIEYKFEISVFLTLLNSLIDITTTWKFYFPPLNLILQNTEKTE